MKKKLNEMTLEELWKLFPIFLSEYKEKWLEYYKEEANTVVFAIGLKPDKNLIERK